jgi:hypothetical protein
MYNLKSTIISLPKIIGCEEFPKSEHGNLLVEDIQNFINKQYRFNGQQVSEAFDMAATHSLFLDGKRINPSTFGKYLSRASVGQVLTAYKEAKRDSNARPSGYNPKQLPEYKSKNITPEESWDLMLKFIKEDGGLPFCAPYIGVYNYLVNNGLMKPVRKATKSGFAANMDGPERQAVEQYLLRNIINTPKHETA